MKNGGFSLIELVIAVALVGVLSTIVTPKVRAQLAKGKDTKAVAYLASMRTASELYYLDNNKSPLEGEETEETIKKAIENILPYLDPKAEKELEDGKIEIGGSRKAAVSGTAEEDIQYGGEINFTFKNPDNSSAVKEDGVYIWFNPQNIGEYDTTGKNKWIEY